jgi:hypothetical protein
VNWGQAVLREGPLSEPPAVTKVQLVGTLNDVQSAVGSEVLHLVWDGCGNGAEQGKLRALVRRRVVVTVELSPLESEASQP